MLVTRECVSVCGQLVIFGPCAALYSGGLTQILNVEVQLVGMVDMAAGVLGVSVQTADTVLMEG